MEKNLKTNEIKEIQLIIDRCDIMVKQFVAGYWTGKQFFNGFNYRTSLLIDAAKVFEKNKIPSKIAITQNNHNINVTFQKAIAPGKKYVYEMQILLNQNQTIKKLGNLNIVEWPKEDLSEITFLKNSGKIFFSSALAKIKVDLKNHERKIIPGNFAKSLTSHSRKASAIRIEWGKPPKYKLIFNYRIKNSGFEEVNDFEIKSYIPPATKFQNVQFPSNQVPYATIINDNDENNILLLKIDKIPANKVINLNYSIIIKPTGNSNIVLPNFGNWKDYQSITNPNTIGEQMLHASKYWPIKNPLIKKLVDAIKKNSINASKFILLAFEFVNQKIKYSMDGIRNDAVSVLLSRVGDCSEMSDLFVCILRAGGVPAKIVHGWTIDLENHSLGPHAWCEFFSPKASGWRQCDPTWGYLTGVSCQHICRQREGLVKEQHTYSWRYRGNSEIKVDENVLLKIIK